ncbi:MAG: ribosome maturation factor RimM [Chloroflexi bacterium]|nr:ribosome maturation factor RimM [Chloroflexota bacterium]
MTDQRENTDDLGESQVVVGTVLGAHGVHGHIRIRILSDVPDRFDSGKTLYLEGSPVLIESSSPAGTNLLLLKLEGINNQSTARALIGQELSAAAESSPPLPEGEYFHYQLMGMQVFTEEGENLGSISEIIVTGSNDVYVVSGAEREILLPAMAQVIRSVDIARMEMVVRLMDGLR